LIVLYINGQKRFAKEMGIEKKDRHDVRGFFARQYGKLVASFAAKFDGLSIMEVEDIVSDLMAEMFGNLDITGNVENLSAYIYRSIQNKAVDYLRRKKKLVSIHGGANDGDRQSKHEPVYDMQERIDADEIIRRLHDALGKLPPVQSEVWVATEVDGLSFRQLAEKWKLPVGTLLARKHRAAIALQKELSDLK
jgi:RNA polymerase sigma factor (sigma-70 family)